jgi:hypothetical protein
MSHATSDRWLPLVDQPILHRIETTDSITGNAIEDLQGGLPELGGLLMNKAHMALAKPPGTQRGACLLRV